MKTALCVSGLAHPIQYCWNSIVEHVVKPNKCDVFILAFENDVIRDRIPLVYDFRETIRNEEYLKVFDIVEDEDCCIDGGGWPVSNVSYMRQIRSFQLSNELMHRYEKVNNIEYDWSIRCRADIMFLRGMHDIVQYSRYGIHIPKFAPCGGVNDRFAFGVTELMDVYCDIYTYICNEYRRMTLSRLTNTDIPHIKRNAEGILEHYLKTMGIKIIFDDHIHFKRVRLFKGRGYEISDD